MLGHILGLSLAKAELLADSFQIGETDILAVKNNVAVFNNMTIGKKCVSKELDGFSSFNCVGANIYAIAGAENKVMSAVNNGGEYHITMTYNAELASTAESIVPQNFDLEYQLAAKEIHFDNMYTENYLWTLNGKEEWEGGEILTNGRIWNMRITDNFTKVELGYKSNSSKDEYTKRWVHDGDLRWNEEELIWLTIGRNCSQPQTANRKDEFTLSNDYSGKIYDCYVPENASATDNRHLWTRIEIHRQVGIERPHAKMTGLGATKFGIDIYLPASFDLLPDGIPIEGFATEYWAAEKGNGGLIDQSNFVSHWGNPNDSTCEKNKDSMGGLYANTLEDLIKRSDDKDANYSLQYGIQLAQGTLALQWNNTTYNGSSDGNNAWLDIIPLWSTDFANCELASSSNFCDHIGTIEWTSGYEYEDLVEPDQDHPTGSYNNPIMASSSCTNTNVYKCTFNNTESRKATVHEGNDEPIMPYGWTGEGTAYVKFEIADTQTNSMFRYDSGHMILAAMAEVYDGEEYTSYSSVYIRNCYLNDVFGYDYLYLTEKEDINCTPTPDNPKDGKWQLEEADISLNMITEVLPEANFWIRRDQNYTTSDLGAEFYFGAKDNGDFTLVAASYKVAGAELKNTKDWAANCVVDNTALTCTKGDQSFKLNVVNDVHRKYHAAAIENINNDYVLYINSCDGFKMKDSDYGSDVMGGGGGTNAPTTAPSKGKGKSNVGVIIGSIFGVLAVGAAGGGTYYFVKKRGNGSDAPDRVTADDYKNSNIAFETNYTAEVEIFDKDYFDDSV